MQNRTGQKRRFLGYGLLNALLTNLSLQVLLVFTGTGIATFCSQIINITLGFVLYGKRVFKVDKLRAATGFKYAAMAILLWCSNWSGINAMTSMGIGKNTSAFLMMPLLAAMSYVIQRSFIFINR